MNSVGSSSAFVSGSYSAASAGTFSVSSSSSSSSSSADTTASKVANIAVVEIEGQKFDAALFELSPSEIRAMTDESAYKESLMKQMNDKDAALRIISTEDDFNKLSTDNLRTVFRRGDLDIILAILRSNRADEIIYGDKRDTLGPLLINAARNSNSALIRRIEEAGLLDQVSLDDLGDALVIGAGDYNFDPETVRIIVNSNGFRLITISKLRNAYEEALRLEQAQQSLQGEHFSEEKLKARSQIVSLIRNSSRGSEVAGSCVIA